MAQLKLCPDTEHEFFRSLFKPLRFYFPSPLKGEVRLALGVNLVAIWRVKQLFVGFFATDLR